MAKLTGGKRLVVEDFDKDDSALVQKLAFVLNPLIEQLINSFSKNITVGDNLNMEFKDVTIELDSNGKPINSAKFQSSISNISGLQVINHRVLTPTASPYPLNHPYCTFKQVSNIVEIQHVTGIAANVRVSLKLLIIGQ